MVNDLSCYYISHQFKMIHLRSVNKKKKKAVPKFPQYYSKTSQNCLKVVPNCPKVVSKFPQSRPKVVQKLSQISSSYPKWPSFWLPCFDFRLAMDARAPVVVFAYCSVVPVEL